MYTRISASSKNRNSLKAQVWSEPGQSSRMLQCCTVIWVLQGKRRRKTVRVHAWGVTLGPMYNSSHYAHFKTEQYCVVQMTNLKMSKICLGKFFAPTRNSLSCRFLLEWLNFTHKISPSNGKCNCTFTAIMWSEFVKCDSILQVEISVALCKCAAILHAKDSATTNSS